MAAELCTGGRRGYQRNCGVGYAVGYSGHWLNSCGRQEASYRGWANASIAHTVNHDHLYLLRTAGGAVGYRGHAHVGRAGAECAIALAESHTSDARAIAITQVGRELPHCPAAVLWTVSTNADYLTHGTGKVSHLRRGGKNQRFQLGFKPDVRL